MKHKCYDLNLAIQSTKFQRQEFADLALELGYKGIAWNYVHKDPKQAIEPPDKTIPLAEKSELKQMRRITLIVQEIRELEEFMQNKHVQQFDIVAVRPGSEAVLLNLRQYSKLVDIISLDCSPARTTMGWSYEKLLPQGIFFELTFGHALRTPAFASIMVSQGLQVARRTGNRNVILCSGACAPLELRAPQDAASLGILFGVDYSTALHFVGTNTNAVMLRAQGRKMAVPHSATEMSLAEVSAAERRAMEPLFFVDTEGFASIGEQDNVQEGDELDEEEEEEEQQQQSGDSDDSDDSGDDVQVVPMSKADVHLGPSSKKQRTGGT